MAKKKAARRSLLQLGVMIVVVALLVVAAVFFQRWFNNRPGTKPQAVAITVETPSGKQEVTPYLVCEVGETCPEGQVTEINLEASDSFTISVPKDVSDHDWALLKIFDDPAANDQSYFGANEKTSVTIAAQGTAAAADQPAPKLVVVEVNSLLIDTNEQGEQIPVNATWSLHVNVTG